MKILIVDDELNNRLLLQKILGRFGHCDMVVNGNEAVEIFEYAQADNAPYDLICMDIMMPGADGQTALRKIRELERKLNIPPREEAVILMISALDSPRVVMDSFRQGGCTDYLTKPITREKLENKLREYSLIGPTAAAPRRDRHTPPA
ncbi:MAG: response regulator [Magnetococcales bacterium]|nr:response regulator [Magnetococcales bacterium]